MTVTVYTTTATIEHTQIDRVEEKAPFVYLYEGSTIYMYNLSYIVSIIQNPNSSDEKLEN